ncbi:MAG: ShlB/FhaC/HecB family hemolysin secretion/activation protein [Alphaproteobacteria bacterium]|nr:ShlB/FhaC/HecB family hemolysin secretion/activation protein [Alphaproteobacteria bacterium]
MLPTRRGRAAGYIAGALFLCTGEMAHAAEPSDPQRVEERLPAEQPKADVAPPPVKVDDEDLGSIPQFVLKAVEFEGMTVIGHREAERCATDLIGQDVGAADLVGLTSCLTALYRDRDFFLSRAIIPQQEVRDGLLTVRVIEGYIAAVQPEGLDQIDADTQFADAFSERPATLGTFERSLLLLADRYGRRITTTKLAADDKNPARYTLKLAVHLAPVTWRVFGDNRGDAYQGPEQGLAAVSFNSLFGASDRIIAQLFTAPTDRGELFFADIGYGRGWFGGDVWTEIGTSISRSSSDGFFPAFVSESERRYARLIVPVLRSREQSLWVKLQADARDTSILSASGATVQENTRILRGSLSYTLVAGATRADIALETAHGLDAFDASKNGDADLSRADARPQFTKTRLDATVTHRLFGHLDVVATGAGQWSDGALVASEEFGAGGARFGRAYDYSEIVGDRGIAGALEVRWTWKKLNDWLTSVQVYAFADAARIWNEDASSEALTSAGGGLRVGLLPGLSASVEVAKPLSRDVVSQGDRAPRVFVSLAAGW